MRMSFDHLVVIGLPTPSVLMSKAAE
jgi:hypothetical protein